MSRLFEGKRGVDRPHPLSPRPHERRALHWLFADTLGSGAAGRAQLEATLDDLMLAARCFHPRHVPKLIGPDLLSAADWSRLAVPTLVLLGEHEKIYHPAKVSRNTVSAWMKKKTKNSQP